MSGQISSAAIIGIENFSRLSAINLNEGDNLGRDLFVAIANLDDRVISGPLVVRSFIRYACPPSPPPSPQRPDNFCVATSAMYATKSSIRSKNYQIIRQGGGHAYGGSDNKRPRYDSIVKISYGDDNKRPRYDSIVKISYGDSDFREESMSYLNMKVSYEWTNF